MTAEPLTCEDRSWTARLEIRVGMPLYFITVANLWC